jgi:hypothetical protein
VKAKRGCNKRHPVCSRCEEKQISCVYTKRTYSEAFTSGFEFDLLEFDMSWTGSPALSSPTNFIDDNSPRPATSGGLDTSCLSALDGYIDPFLTFAENQAAVSSDMQLMNSAGGQLGKQIEEEQALSQFDYAPMADICVCYSFTKA